MWGKQLMTIHYERIGLPGHIQRTVIVTLSILFAVILFPYPVHAQVELSGYYENMFQVIDSDDSDYTMFNTSKFRVDFHSGGGEQELEFRGNVNAVVYHGATKFDLAPYLPQHVVDELTQYLTSLEMEFERERIFLDNAFLTWRSGSFRVRAGRQQLSWGPGYFYNPTDLFHKKNPLDPTYEKEGVNAIRIDYHWGIGGRLTAIAAPGDDFESTGYAARFEYFVSSIGYDMAVTYHNVKDSTSLYPMPEPGTIPDLSRLPLTTRIQDREAIGFEASGALLGLGVWLEGNYNIMEVEDDFYRVIAGVDYTLESGLYMMCEVMYNGRAEKEPPYPVDKWMANIRLGEPVGQWTALAGVQHDITDLVTFGMYAFGGNDESYVLNPRIDISIANNADLVLYGGYSFGEEDGQYLNGQRSLFARGTVYF